MPLGEGSGRPSPVIGLTGGIATGKSTVAAMLARRGARVVASDQIAREVVEPGTPGLAAVVEAVGSGFLTAEGALDRPRLGAAIFADPALRHRLEAITHPLIRRRSAELVAEAAAGHPPLIVVDVPLLFETGGEARFPGGVMLAYTDPATQLRRLREREQLTPEAAQQRLDAQLPIDAKRPRATWIIDNRGSPEDTETQVHSWWQANVGGPGS